MTATPGSLTYAAFNGMLEVFLAELCTILGEVEPGVKDVYRAFQVMKNDPTKQRMPMELFVTGVSPFAAVIQNKDETFITGGGSNGVAFLKSIHLDRHWGQFDPQQKEGMWQFLIQLLTLGGMLMSIPESAMSGVESMAMNILQGGAGFPDPSALANMLQQPPPSVQK